MKKVYTNQNKKPKHTVIDIENYERYWSNSTNQGHQIKVVCKNDNTYEFNFKWPKGFYPRRYNIEKF
jgi:putative heme iron utilization protein